MVKFILNYLILNMIYLMLLSCSDNTFDREATIKKFDSIDFAEFKDIDIEYRSGGKTSLTSIYFISLYSKNISPYIVEYNHATEKVVEVSNKLLKYHGRNDYLNTKRIIRLANKFAKYKLISLTVDTLGNAYINANYIDSNRLLKTVSFGNTLIDTNYKHLKRNWYKKK